MTGSSDCLDLYALAGERSRETVRRFREEWLSGYAESADDYVFPLYADPPEAVYTSPWELIDRLLVEPMQPHSLYWRNPDPCYVLHAMLFFTVDGAIIAGLTVSSWDTDLAGSTLRRLAETVDARYAYTLWEQPPPDSAAEFQAEARKADLPRLLP